MAIASVMLRWFERLKDLGAFAGPDLLEIGPSTITAGPATCRGFFDRLAAPASPTAQAVWGALGLTDYESLDAWDSAATHRANLNEPLDMGRRWNTISEAGTFEHVFNIGQAFKTVHDHLAPGGCAIHVLPAIGDYGHGFFNIHSTLYRDLAHANGYEIVDLVYVPNHHGQNLALEMQPDALPCLVNIANGEPFNRLMVDLPEACGVWADFIFAALRKVNDAPFVYPMQGVYRHGLPGEVAA